MIKIFIYIKHKLSFLWTIAEWCNGVLFGVLYDKKINNDVEEITKKYNNSYYYRLITENEITALQDFFLSQPESVYKYFKPHKFDIDTLNRLYKNKSFYMFGVFDKETIIGYFMLRFFINKQAFAGFLVGANHQGEGIAKTMGKIMFNICWQNNFRVFATVSKNNIAALKSYRSINDFTIIKELPDNYIYIEYTKVGDK